jgi:hypothetical protein
MAVGFRNAVHVGDAASIYQRRAHWNPVSLPAYGRESFYLRLGCPYLLAIGYSRPPRWNLRAAASLPTTTGSKPASRTNPSATAMASGPSAAIGMQASDQRGAAPVPGRGS